MNLAAIGLTEHLNARKPSRIPAFVARNARSKIRNQQQKMRPPNGYDPVGSSEK